MAQLAERRRPSLNSLRILRLLQSSGTLHACLADAPGKGWVRLVVSQAGWAAGEPAPGLVCPMGTLGRGCSWEQSEPNGLRLPP